MNLKPEIVSSGLQLFVGDASEACARVYATLPRDGLPDDAQLAGELGGPYCRYSQTLPARIRFVDRGPGATLLAEAIVPDPCFWSPELPFTYSAQLRVVAGGNCLTAVERPIGIRRLGIHRLSIYLNAKRFVFRGVGVETATLAGLATARQAGAALFVHEPSDEFLQEASQEGVLLAVRARAAEELISLGRWPAVAVVVLDGILSAGKELRLAARNTLLAQFVATADSPVPLARWAQLLWWQIDAEETIAAAPPYDIPVIAYRSDTKNATIDLGRRACDHLQAELAALGDFAGYVV